MEDIIFSDQRIIELFDSTNITLSELSAISGRSVSELKKLLMGDK
jgi:predicted HTH domain antitoxin